THAATLGAVDAAPGDRFGAAVAIEGERIAVGAPGQAEGRGGVYLYDEAADGWTQEAHLVSRTVAAGDALGSAVLLWGEKVIASAGARDNAAGALYIFEVLDPEQGWAAYTRLFPFVGNSQTLFGASLDMSGPDLLVGAPGSDGFHGAVYRFRWDEAAAIWADAEKLRYDEIAPGDFFGAALAVSGDVAVAAAPGDDFGTGAASVLARVAGEWTFQDRLVGETASYPAITGERITCGPDGMIAQFECASIELLSFVPREDVGAGRGIELNDLWGWTDPETGKEWALVGRMDGTSFVDVSDPLNPVFVGTLPMTEGARANAWRDIKVYQDHAYIVADGAGQHGVQVFDLTRLRDVPATEMPLTFDADALYDRVASVHNIVIDTASGFAFAVGSNSGGETCGGGLHMIDIRDPKAPAFAGCFADPQTGQAGTGYSHDAQCVTYTGPDQDYTGREICLGSNETALSIADVTDKDASIAIARASYPNVAYTHQGWLTEDQRYFYMDDEGDEMAGLVPRTRTIIWDVSDLDDPQVVGEFLGATAAIDHNLYIVGDRMYQSNYVAGLRVIDISDRTNPREIGFFDSVPYGGNVPTFNGSWSNYPFFESGIIVFTSGKEGLFIVRDRTPVS
ncbi:MAG: choice-of-anchor B family protein, partial [Longimicrobiales bacterium]